LRHGLAPFLQEPSDRPAITCMEFEFLDYRDQPDLANEAAYCHVFELELILGAEPTFASITRYPHESLKDPHVSHVVVPLPSVFRGNLLRCDLVFEVVRIERVEATVARFRLGIHQEADRCAARSRQGNIVREVVGHPVHFPRPK